MSIRDAIRASGTTYSAYRYEGRDLVWAELVFSNGTIKFRDAQGREPHPLKWEGKNDWKPWRKGNAVTALREELTR